MLLLLGLLLLGATGAFIGLAIAYNTTGGPDYTVTMFGNTLGTLNGLHLFLAGIALTLVLGLAVAMTARGARRQLRHRAARRAVLSDAKQARAERDALAARLGDDQELTQLLTAPDAGSSSQSRAPRTATTSATPTTSTKSTTSTGRRMRRPHVFGH